MNRTRRIGCAALAAAVGWFGGGCANHPPMRPAGQEVFQATAADVYCTVDAALVQMEYSTYYGNKGLVVASRAHATIAAPFTMATSVAFFPVGMVGGAVLGPIDPDLAWMPLVAVGIADAGWAHRQMYIQVLEEPAYHSVVTIRATHKGDADNVWKALHGALGGPAEGTP